MVFGGQSFCWQEEKPQVIDVDVQDATAKSPEDVANTHTLVLQVRDASKMYAGV